MSAIIFDHVRVLNGNRLALDDVSVALEAGMLTGIIGPNGAGKTTLMRAALGLARLQGGAITIHGTPLGAWKRETLARRLAYLPQGGSAVWPMTGYDVAMLGRLPHRAGLGRPVAADHVAVETALTRAHAVGLAHRRLDAMSAGERARVLLARALATGADILLADEPAAFLDPAHQLSLMELLQAEAARGVAVAVSLHDLTLARRCDRLIVLQNGQIAAFGGAECLTDAVLSGVFGLSARRGVADDGCVIMEFNKN